MARYFKDAFVVAGGAVAHTFGPVTSETRLRDLLVHANTAPTTVGDFTLPLDSVNGSEHDLKLYALNLAAAATTDVFNTDLDLLLLPGDALKVAYANADGRTLGVQLIFE